jgi:hypothetical protein
MAELMEIKEGGEKRKIPHYLQGDLFTESFL